MIQKYESMWDEHLRRIVGAKHRNVLNPTDAPSIPSAPYREVHVQRELERVKVVQMKKVNVAEHAVAEWAPYIVFVPKKNGNCCFGVNSRRLIALTACDSYRILRMDECIHSPGEAKLISNLDANLGQRQTKIGRRDVNEIAFVTHDVF